MMDNLRRQRNKFLRYREAIFRDAVAAGIPRAIIARSLAAGTVAAKSGLPVEMVRAAISQAAGPALTITKINDDDTVDVEVASTPSDDEHATEAA